MKKFRTRKNLVTAKEAESILSAVGLRHQRILAATSCRESLRTAAKREGLTANATSKAIRIHSIAVLGRSISVQGFRRSLLLHEISGGAKWDALESKYGAQMVKTACADFVREFAPKIVVDNLASGV